MGFCGYYRKFIQNFSKLAKCLHNLTEKGRKFEWTNECQSAFEELKNRLVASPILAHPDFSKKFILDTDASNEAIGARTAPMASGLRKLMEKRDPSRLLVEL